MAKYVCNTGVVCAYGASLCELASTMKGEINSYSSSISTELSSWSGEAKSSFDSSNTNQINASNTTFDYINSLGEFIKDAAKKIDELEENLAALTI